MVADPYKALGLSHSASPEEIKKTYRCMARKFHPDKMVKKTGMKAIAAAPSSQITTQAAVTPDFAEMAAAYAILSDPRRKAQYDHVYKYGGFDAEPKQPRKAFSTAANPAKTSSSRGKTNGSTKRPRKGVGYSCNDPIFTYVFSQGKISSTQAVAGIELPSRLSMNQVRLAFSAGQSFKTDPRTGRRIYTSETTHFEQGQRYTRTEKMILHKDGKREVLVTDKDGSGHQEKSYFVTSGSPIADHDSSWYLDAWKTVKDKCLMCYSPCTAVVTN